MPSVACTATGKLLPSGQAERRHAESVVCPS